MASREDFKRNDPFERFSPMKKMKKPQGQSRYMHSDNEELIPLPYLNPNMNARRQEGVFISKIRQCCVLFHFETPDIDSDGKKIKCKALKNLIHYITYGHNVLTDAIYPEIVDMFACNIFHTLPPNEFTDVDAKEIIFENSWTHLNLVYEVFLSFLESRDFQSFFAVPYINEKFIIQLLKLFDSVNRVERQLLKIILHRIYNRCVTLREIIKREVKYVLIGFINGTEHLNGINEILNFMESLIIGFAVPLKFEYKQFAIKVLVPLHKKENLPSFYEQLGACMTPLIKKEPLLCRPVIRGLLRIWPKSSARKETIYLNEIESMIEEISLLDFYRIQNHLFRQISKCVSSPHYQVAKHALNFCRNKYVVNLIMQNCDEIMPLIAPAVNDISKHYWNKTILLLSRAVLIKFQRMNPGLFNELIQSEIEELARRAHAMQQAQMQQQQNGRQQQQNLQQQQAEQIGQQQRKPAEEEEEEEEQEEKQQQQYEETQEKKQGQLEHSEQYQQQLSERQNQHQPKQIHQHEHVQEKQEDDERKGREQRKMQQYQQEPMEEQTEEEHRERQPEGTQNQSGQYYQEQLHQKEQQQQQQACEHKEDELRSQNRMPQDQEEQLREQDQMGQQQQIQEQKKEQRQEQQRIPQVLQKQLQQPQLEKEEEYKQQKLKQLLQQLEEQIEFPKLQPGILERQEYEAQQHQHKAEKHGENQTQAQQQSGGELRKQQREEQAQHLQQEKQLGLQDQKQPEKEKELQKPHQDQQEEDQRQIEQQLHPDEAEQEQPLDQQDQQRQPQEEGAINMEGEDEGEEKKLEKVFLDEIDPYNLCSLSKKIKTKRTFVRYVNLKAQELEKLPPLRYKYAAIKQEQLLIQKLRQCCIPLNFFDPMAEWRAKIIKYDTLSELSIYITRARGALTDTIYPEMIHMVACNIFRTLPPQDYKDFDNDVNFPIIDAAWPSLQLVYDVFASFLYSKAFRGNIAENFIDEKFISELLELFDSEDERERVALKNVLHRIYSNCINVREFIKKHIGFVFLTFIYETKHFSGVGELLEVFASIVKGFGVPLKLEYKQFLFKVLLPMHKLKCLSLYHEKLSYCVLQFLKKDPLLAEPFIKGLLNIWPRSHAQKEAMFLVEIDEILSVIILPPITTIQERLFIKLFKCLSSSHFLVARYARHIWNKSTFISAINENNAIFASVKLDEENFELINDLINRYENAKRESAVKEVRKKFSYLQLNLVANNNVPEKEVGEGGQQQQDPNMLG